MLVNQQTNWHSAAAIINIAVMMQRRRCNKVSVSSSRQRQCLRTVLVLGPAKFTKWRMMARCDGGLALAKEALDMSVVPIMLKRIAMRTQHWLNVCM